MIFEKNILEKAIIIIRNRDEKCQKYPNYETMNKELLLLYYTLLFDYLDHVFIGVLTNKCRDGNHLVYYSYAEKCKFKAFSNMLLDDSISFGHISESIVEKIEHLKI